jgi:ABC-type branched-subunit amino acid transport system ATPase component
MPIPEARAIVAKAKALPGVIDVMPKIDGQVMAVGQGGNLARGAVVTGLAPSDLSKLKIVSGNLVGGNLKTWGVGEYGGDEIAMGSRLAEALGVLPGDSVQLISPQGASTPFGTTPRIKDYTVSAIFDIGMSEYDATFIYMPIEQAHTFFESVPTISRFLKTLCDVGLGYVRLGQSAPTLSGGEAQRVKLATELQRRSTGRTIYVLDEPTTGLHFEDVNKLLGVLNRLVESGNTVVVIEHNLDVIKSSDWVIDMGPEGGFRGGTVVAEGTPEQVSKITASYTGHFLSEVLKINRKAPAKKK